MLYKNRCKFPIFIRTLGIQIAVNETFNCGENNEILQLLKESKIEKVAREKYGLTKEGEEIYRIKVDTTK